MPISKLQKWAGAVWCIFLPIMTLVLGPFRPALFKDHKVNTIWDPIYSFGWTFVNEGNRHRDTGPTAMALIAILFLIFAFCLIVLSGYKIWKSKIKVVFKWICFAIILSSFFLTITIEQAATFKYLHFFILEIS
jgi:hypothetical protein